MNCQEAVTTQFIPRSTAALQGIANALVAAGLPANRVTVSMPEDRLVVPLEARWPS